MYQFGTSNNEILEVKNQPHTKWITGQHLALKAVLSFDMPFWHIKKEGLNVKKPPQAIEKMIYVVRGQKVMLDSDLAELYGVETKMLKRAVKRNIGRFPSDFMFEFTKEELINWRYQFGTSNKEKMGLRIPPFAFTENGIAMLSGVLSSDRAITVNISIMRTFTKLRALIVSDEALPEKTDMLFRVVFERLDTLEANTPILPKTRKKIGIK